MKRIFDWQVALGLALVVLSALIYALHYALFRDAHHIFIYFVGDVAFVPIEVLLVTLIIHRLLSLREKRALRGKMNMVVGAFFSELGTELIEELSVVIKNSGRLAGPLGVNPAWKDKDFQAARAFAKGFEADIEIDAQSLYRFKALLVSRRGSMLRLLENPNLIEHDVFSDLLWAVFHLLEELEAREAFEGLPGTDYEHIKGDMRRAHDQLLLEWLTYMEHLKEAYPFLFSLAVRTNPLDPEADPAVRA